MSCNFLFNNHNYPPNLYLRILLHIYQIHSNQYRKIHNMIYIQAIHFGVKQYECYHHDIFQQIQHQVLPYNL